MPLEPSGLSLSFRVRPPMTTTDERWERFLDPEVVKPSLFLATMFITTFEILKDSVVNRVRDFYMTGFDEEGLCTSPSYLAEVASRNKSLLYASLDWLREHGAINQADLQTCEELKRTRNLLAHKLFAVVTGEVESQHSSQFSTLMELLRKIEVWWVVNVELATNPSFANREVDEAGIVPGPVLSLQMLIEVASGNTELLEHWRKVRRSGSAQV